MEDDPVMRMYEAQAIAVEKEQEINKLEAEKKELERKIRQLELEKSTDKLDDVWTAINKLQKEMRESGDNSVRLQQENEEKFEARMEAIKRQITGVNDLLAQNLLEMNKFKEETRGYLQTAQSLQEKMRKDLTEQIESNTDQARSLHLQITKVSSKVDQIQETITNQVKRFDSLERTLDSSSQNIVKLNTILIMGGADYCTRRTMTVLSTYRSGWIELQLELPYSVFGSGAVFLQNELYVVGGQHNLKALYKLDENLKWKRLADMNVGRNYIANICVEVNGYIWVFGGEEYGIPLKSVERYDPKKNKWTLMPEMSTARADAAAVFCKDRIIVCGGRSEKETTGSAECFLLETGEWTQFPPLPDRFAGHSLVSFENKLILMGGWKRYNNNTDEYLKSVREMDPLQPKDGWKSLPLMKYSRGFFPGLVLDQEIYAVGGYNSTSLDCVKIFDGKSWRDGPSLPYKRHRHSAVVIPESLADRLCRNKP